MLTLQMADRQCGDCHECCVRLPIIDEKLEKPGYEPCKHLNGKGCGIYTDPDKPKICSSYKCLWLDGTIPGDERRRPDRLGVLFQDSPVLTALECRQGALDSPQALYMVDWLSKRLKARVAVSRYEPHRKDEMFEAAKRFLKKSA